MRQTYDKNLADLNAFQWENFLKLITGPGMKQWLLNWLDSFAEGKLTTGETIEEAIAALKLNGGGGGEGNVFSEQFKLIDEKIWWDVAYLAAKYNSSSEDISRVTYIDDLVDNNYPTIYSGSFGTTLPSPARLKVNFDAKIQADVNISDYGITFSYGLTTVPTIDITTEWQSFEITQPTAYDNASFSINLGDGITTIGSGSIFDFKNVVIRNADTDEIISHTPTNPYFTHTTLTQISGSPFANLKGTRILPLILTGAGVKPTLPATGALPGSINWLDTDMMPGEIFAFNITDEKFFYNNGTEIKEWSNTGTGGDITRERVTLSAISNNIALNFNNKNELVATNIIDVSGALTVSYSNATNAEFCTFSVNFINEVTLTFASGTTSSDDNFQSLVYTPPTTGIFTFSIYKRAGIYDLLTTQKASV